MINNLILLEEGKIDALLVSTVSNIIYLTGFSSFSREEREAFILLTKKNSYIFTDARYSEAVINQIPHYVLQEFISEKRLHHHLLEIAEKEGVKTVGFEPDNLTVAEFTFFRKELKLHLKLVPAKGLIERFRIKKTSQEIQHIQKACDIADNAFEIILKHIKPGVTEKQIAFVLESYFREQNATISFPPIVAFGRNSSVPHHAMSDTKLTDQSVVLLDFGAKVENYCSDMTRTVFLKTPTTDEAEMYKSVLEANIHAIEYVKRNYNRNKQNLKGNAVDAIARNSILNDGFASIPHAVGHGIGIDVHEAPVLSPKSKHTLSEGMVFSIEPGIYVPGKMGVRIEDLVALNNDKIEILTNSRKEVIVVSR